ncbi:MAG: phage portal protein [Candidatus Obscuribacterales bacterium]|nr:phage portal protein [Candidatus Obscuribacterales bacterium]
MGILRGLLEKRSHPSNPSDKIVQLFGGGSQAYTGRFINTDQAMRYPVFAACVGVISSAAMTLPWFIYEYKKDDKKEIARKFSLYGLLHDQPHPNWTSADFVEFILVCLLTNGNFYALIERTEGGVITKLTPIHPSRVRIDYVKLLKDDPELVFYYQPKNGGAEIPLFLGRDLFYIRGMSLDGICGVSPIRMLMEAIGLGLAAEEFGAKLFGNGASPRGVLLHPNKLNGEKAKDLREQFERANSGLDNVNRVAVLEEGMKFESISLAADEAQFLETRKFQRSEIYGAMRVQAHKVGDLEHATFSNIEHQNIEFVQSTMLPWMRRIEQCARRDLLSTTEKLLYSIEFKLDGLLRGDIKTRYEAYAIGRQNGFLSGNDIRDLENMEPYEGGEIYWRPVNMVPADTPVAVPKEARTNNPYLIGLQEITQERRNHDAVIAEIKNVIADAVQRSVSKESKALTRQVEKVSRGGTLKEFQSWTDEFYGQFRTEMTTTLMPAVRALGALTEGFSDKAIDDIVGKHVERSIQLIGEIMSGDLGLSDKLKEMTRAISEWKETRKDELLDLLEDKANGS